MAAMTGTAAWVADSREWHCYQCAAPLAEFYSYGVIRFLSGLRRLDDVDGLPAFGLAPRVLTGKSARGRGDTGWDAHLPWGSSHIEAHVIVYCPRSGVCGRKQHLYAGPELL